MSVSPAVHAGWNNLLQVNQLTIEAPARSGKSKILDRVDLLVGPGEIVGLVGESGAGKSTLGMAALGFIQPSCRVAAGSVIFDGVDLFSLSESRRRKLRGTKIAYVAQSAAAAFNPSQNLIKQTIETACYYGILSRGEAEAQAKRLYRQLQLPDPDNFGHRYPHQVSGGQLQRAMTAMALLCRPKLVIFDEPTTALDVTTQVEVLAAIKSALEHYSTGAIYITHDLAVVMQVAHRIAVLRYGQKVEEGPTSEIALAPKHPYTKTLWAVRKVVHKEKAGAEELLRIENVSAAYGKVAVLHSVSLTISRGCTLAIVGESGSGKSTLARVIAGLLAPTSGTVVFKGSSLPKTFRKRDRELLRRIQLVYQSPDGSLNPHQTVRDAIGRPLALYAKLRGELLDRRVIELLELVEMDRSFLRRLPHEMSGGQKQRVALARAFAANPELIICDEVTSSLDQNLQAEMLNLLMRLQKQLMVTYCFITHDISTVRAIADNVLVLKSGHVVDCGSRDKILRPPHHDYTEMLLRSEPKMDPDWLNNLLKSRLQVPASHSSFVRDQD